jgi:hypothetical protein
MMATAQPLRIRSLPSHWTAGSRPTASTNATSVRSSTWEIRHAASTASSVATTASVVRTQYVHGGQTWDHAGT